jgi:hypothetical protein
VFCLPAADSRAPGACAAVERLLPSERIVVPAEACAGQLSAHHVPSRWGGEHVTGVEGGKESEKACMCHHVRNAGTGVESERLVKVQVR